LNVHEDNDVRQAEIRTVEPLVPEPSAFEVELAIGMLKNYKSPGIDQIPAELINLMTQEFSSRSAIQRAHCAATLVAIRLFKGPTVRPL